MIKPEELRDTTMSVEERVNNLVSNLGLNGDARSVIVPPKKGDMFKLVNMNKYIPNSDTDSSQSTDFVTILFVGNTGISINARNFTNIAGTEEIEDFPSVGTTVAENARFLVYCIDNKILFKITKVESEDIPASNGRQGYTKRTYYLAIVTEE